MNIGFCPQKIIKHLYSWEDFLYIAVFHRELGHSYTTNCQSPIHPFLTPTHLITTSFNSDRSYFSLGYRVYYIVSLKFSNYYL